MRQTPFFSLEFPLFCNLKKSSKWRLLIDLQNVNTSMWPMGTLQPGLPTDTSIPKDWSLTVLDLEDYFYTINIYMMIRYI